MPAGPRKLTGSPFCRVNRNVDPGPPGTRLKSSSIAPGWDGGDAMVYGRVTGKGSPGFGTSNDTNWPARKWISDGSISSSVVARTSCVRSSTRATWAENVWKIGFAVGLR